MITAEDVLTVLNGLEPVELADLHFAVAVEPGERPVHAGSPAGMVWTVSWFPFERGEIIAVSRGNDREPFGEGRKPAKWSVRFEYFDDLAAAQDCRERVLAPVAASQETTGAEQ